MNLDDLSGWEIQDRLLDVHDVIREGRGRACASGDCGHCTICRGERLLAELDRRRSSRGSGR